MDKIDQAYRETVNPPTPLMDRINMINKIQTTNRKKSGLICL